MDASDIRASTSCGDMLSARAMSESQLLSAAASKLTSA
jgi:hypothetical protein